MYVEEDPHTFDTWFNLLVNNKLLVSIKGKETAEWFLRMMQYGSSTEEIYTLVRRPTNTEDVQIDDIKAVQPW